MAAVWLPSKFLTDDDILRDKENDPVQKTGLKNEQKMSLSFPNEFPYEFDLLDSALSSPVESVMGSTETENTSDEEDFLAGLTRRLTHSTQKLAVPASLSQDRLKKSWVLASSPESTLSGIGSWSVSSNESPNGSSLVSSPTTPFGGQNDTWDLISAAAGQVARLKMSNSSEAVKYNNNSHARSVLAPPKSSSPVHVIKNPNFGFYAGHSVNFDLASTNQYQQYVKQDAMLKTQCGGSVREKQQLMRPTWSSQPEQIQNKARNFGYESARCGRPLGQLAQSAWPPLQVPHQYQQKPQQRPVIFGGSGGVKRECAGTGVFLPRRYGNNLPDCRKKPVPTKIVHALNLSCDDINVHAQHHQRFNTGFSPNYDTLLARRNALVTLQKRSLRPDAARSHEIHLPQEWTY